MASLRNTKFDEISKAAAEEEEIERKLAQADLDRVKLEAEAVRSENQESDSDDEEELSPLFWTKPPSMRKKASPAALEMEKTLNSMIYDDKPPLQLATEAKDRGNNALKQGFFDVARDAYKEGLKFARQAWTEECDPSELISTLLCNRAQVELQVKNYRQAIRDCNASLKLLPNGPVANKARFRAAKACLALHKPGEALKDFLDQVPLEEDEKQQQLVAAGSESEPVNKELALLVALKRECLALSAKQELQAQQRAKALLEVERDELQYRQRLQSHGVKIGPLTMDLQAYTGGSEKVGGPGPRAVVVDAQTGAWSWPVLFMYPEVSQSDFVQAFEEGVSFKQMLDNMFAQAPDWDLELGCYRKVSDLDVFVREHQVRAFDLTRPFAAQIKLEQEEQPMYGKTRWFKIALDKTLGQVLHHAGIVVPGIPTFIVVSRKSTAYYRTFVQACQTVDGGLVERNVF